MVLKFIQSKLQPVAMASIFFLAFQHMPIKAQEHRKEKCSITGLVMKYDEGKKDWVPTYKNCKKPEDQPAENEGFRRNDRCRGAGPSVAYDTASASWKRVYIPCKPQ